VIARSGEAYDDWGMCDCPAPMEVGHRVS
jgi:hypothetical protein